VAYCAHVQRLALCFAGVWSVAGVSLAVGRERSSAAKQPRAARSPEDEVSRDRDQERQQQMCSLFVGDLARNITEVCGFAP
jgi:hypothetical protein